MRILQNNPSGSEKEGAVSQPAGSTNLKRAMLVSGGVGAVLWGLSILLLFISMIVFVAYMSSASAGAGPSLNPTDALVVTDAFTAFSFYLISSILIIIGGAKLLRQQFSWKTFFALLVTVSIANILVSVLLFAGNFEVNYGILIVTSSVLAIIGGSIAWARSVAAKLAGSILGIVSVILFTISFGAPLFLLNTPLSFLSPGGGAFGALSFIGPAFELIVISLILALVIMIVTLFLESYPRIKNIFYIILAASPLLFGVGLSLGSFGVASGLLSLGNYLSAPYSYSPALAPILAIYWMAVISSLIAGIGGLLLIVGSSVGFAYGATVISHSMRASQVSVQSAVATPEVPAPSSTQSAPAGKFCRNCGAKLAGDEKFCRNCGAKL